MGCALMKPTPLAEAPGGNMQMARESRGMSLEEAADKLGITPEYLADVEANRAARTKALKLRVLLVYRHPAGFYHRRVRNNFGKAIHICGEDIKACACCPYCADYLCDWPIDGKETCDAPLCEDHAETVGDDLHFCPAHLATAKLREAAHDERY